MRRALGVTLVEMMVGLAIVGFLLFAAVPAFSTFMQNQRVRAVGESLSNGLQLARAEAVKRNGTVEMVLTDDDPVPAGVSSVTASATGKNWVVRYYNPATMFYEFVEGRSGSVGSGTLGSTPVVVTAGNATVAFNGLGRTTLATASTYAITNPTAGSCVPAGTVRCLNIVVSPAGQVRMCDPDPSLTARDTRKC